MAASPSRVAVVTGSNKGIGFAIVRGLCKQFSGTVILTARNENLGKEAVDKLKEEGLNPVFHQLDITSQESINKLRDYLSSTYKGLDLLINNAGIAYKGASIAPFSEQAEVTARTNFTGTLNICDTLFPLLRPHARVVNVASLAGLLKIIPSEAIKAKFTSPSLTQSGLVGLVEEFISDVKAGVHKEKGWSNSAYGMSKVAVIALTKVQARQMEKDPRQDILVNCCCPGYVDTDMSSHKGHLTIDQGAETPIYCALLPEGCGHSGEFFSQKKVVGW
ncbi:predicted protein [Nematostella vectensis]|uniref:carbonyl reductase (NADPH) n=1 Tax=Nematostella vectensis TaxID=45351 RepID=A7RGK5_NEMVE|nr:carbonyl reductase [NADPH] 1 [Nematostella vectensis]EDO49544.1 predicted protein [Nematostella vectensis]|eukprot:XP_001641607.1 predicted protein [Nematostella vectensis]